ncbi:enolase-phosphatase E1-like [Liolophura sinensis]|uniref:enolase-phosphatase E1-like n=1 Tax=Liolophura sinensis TaxID=3198878 RepID=UPI00315928C7
MAPQKRTAEEADALLEGIQVLLLDIEGTTTPISFVKDKLFPYVRENVETYLTNHFAEEECVGDVTALRELAAKDVADGVEGAVAIPGAESPQDAVVKAVVDSVGWQMNQDRKSTALKQLQGHIWREAYKQGKVKGELFDDVAPAIKQLVEDGKKVYIYSSGSTEAQKLLFAHSTEGDLSESLTGYFDTNVGSKTESDSYKKISEEVGVKPEEILFLTDIPQEASAAVKAGMKSQLVVRPGNAALTEDDKKNFPYIESFDELLGAEDGTKKLAPGEEGDADGDQEADDANGDGDEAEAVEGEESNQ